MTTDHIISLNEQLKWDVQFHEGVREMFRYQRSCADFFRRKCNVGYSKASSWVEQLEAMGFLGPRTTDGSARKILVTFAQWLAWLDGQGVTYDKTRDTYQDPWVEEPHRALPRPAVAVIPDHILALAERLRTQDNLATASPIWHVQVKRAMGQWVTVKVALTRKGADDYLAIDGHNLKNPRIFVESNYRCQEMIDLREWLMSLKATVPA